MITYFDTSAFVPLIIEEPSSALCERLWAKSSGLISSRLIFVESKAAFAMAHRMRRITPAQLKSSNRILEKLIIGFDFVEVEESLVSLAGELTQKFDLRGYDAIHLASCHLVRNDDLILATGDKQLANAASSYGISVAKT